VYFYTVLVIEKKRNLAPRVHENTPFWPPKSLKKICPQALLPVRRGCGEGTSPTLPSLAPSALDLGPSTSTPGSAYLNTALYALPVSTLCLGSAWAR